MQVIILPVKGNSGGFIKSTDGVEDERSNSYINRY
jgi:hypothetical protein